MKAIRSIALTAAIAAALLGAAVAPAQAATHHTVWVSPGTGTISAAVANARPGDTIRLKSGTYLDSVFIPISLTIRGSGWHTVVKPPATSDNPCNSPASSTSPASVEGFCALGAVDANFNPDLTKPVENVSISDLRVTGFSDGIFGFNTRGLRVDSVRADHNAGYGIARFNSTDSLFEENWASWNGEAGLYMGDSPHANSVLRDNTADHNGFGLFLRDSTDITAVRNRVWDNCVGILALNSGNGAPGDLPAGDYRIARNAVWDNDSVCPARPDDGQPPLSGLGIALAGVHDTLVVHNTVRDNHPGGPTAFSGGIAIVSDKQDGGADPTNNTVRNNELHNNKVVDIFWDGTGSGNRVRHNECSTAQPPNLGWCTE
jgi:parallel beta-helix repeat protein